MSFRPAILGLALAGASVWLSACTTTADAPAPQPVAAPVTQPGSYVTPAGFRLPEGAGCTGEIARFRAVMDNDLATGHVAREVHGRVLADLRGSEEACAAGQAGEAGARLRAVKNRYGYP